MGKEDKEKKIVQIGFNAIITWQKVDEPDGQRLVAHEFREMPEIKIVKVRDGLQGLGLIHLDKNDNPIPKQQQIFEETMQNVAALLKVEPEQALEALREKGEEGIPYIDIFVRNMPITQDMSTSQGSGGV